MKTTTKSENREPSKGFGTASLVLGIAGFVFVIMPYFAIFFSIIAIVFANLQKKACPSARGTAGLVLGIIGVIVNIIFLLIVLLVLLAAGSISNI